MSNGTYIILYYLKKNQIGSSKFNIINRMTTFFVLITGMPGTGKTTIVQRLVDEFRKMNNRLEGFLTEELRNEYGNRIGFDVVSLDGSKRGILARNNESCGNSKHKVGNYSVDTTSLDSFLQPIYKCKSNTDMLIIDEIGKMELKSVFFVNFINEIVGASDNNQFSYKVIVATVPIVKFAPIVERLKCLPNSKLFTVTKANRSVIYNEIKSTITDHLCKWPTKTEQ